MKTGNDAFNCVAGLTSIHDDIPIKVNLFIYFTEQSKYVKDKVGHKGQTNSVLVI